MIVQFLTVPLDEGCIERTVLPDLFDMYHEVRLYFDDEPDSATIANN